MTKRITIRTKKGRELTYEAPDNVKVGDRVVLPTSQKYINKQSPTWTATVVSESSNYLGHVDQIIDVLPQNQEQQETPTVATPARFLTLPEAVTEVLYNARKPVHVKDITDRILENNLWASPSHCNKDQIYDQVQKAVSMNKKKKQQQPFKQTSRGFYCHNLYLQPTQQSPSAYNGHMDNSIPLLQQPEPTPSVINPITKWIDAAVSILTLIRNQCD